MIDAVDLDNVLEIRPENELLGNVVLYPPSFEIAFKEGVDTEHFGEVDTGNDYLAACRVWAREGTVEVSSWVREAIIVSLCDEKTVVHRFKRYTEHASFTPAASQKGVARAVVEDADRRALAEYHAALSRKARDATTPLHLIEDVKPPTTSLDRLAAAIPDQELVEMMTTPPTDPDWLIPGLLAKQERLIVTGYEGRGKSTLLRQIAVCVAAGVNPFTNEGIEPQRVLLVDLENGHRLVREKLRPMYHQLEGRYQVPNLRIVCRTDGLDLNRQRDADWLIQRAKVNDAKLIITGPLYKMALGDPKDEEVARNVAFALDRVREELGCSFVIEAHCGHGNDGKERPERPYGASLWMRWPEFGLHLSESGDLNHWRGPRDERAWPVTLDRGGWMPWSPGKERKDTSKQKRGRWNKDSA